MSVPQTVRLTRHAGDLDDDGHDLAGSVIFEDTATALGVTTVQGAIEVLALSLAGGGMVPYAIASGETFTVPLGRQALFSETIDVDPDGDLVVDGMLIEVD